MIAWIKQLIEQWEGKYPLGVSRSPEWPKTEREFKAAGNDSCIVCETKEDIEIHHVLVFHLNPADELNWKNLRTLCREHHFEFGHLRSWKSWNVNVVEDSATWNKKILTRP